jgi:hypothetical protein
VGRLAGLLLTARSLLDRGATSTLRTPARCRPENTRASDAARHEHGKAGWPPRRYVRTRTRPCSRLGRRLLAPHAFTLAFTLPFTLTRTRPPAPAASARHAMPPPRRARSKFRDTRLPPGDGGGAHGLAPPQCRPPSSTIVSPDLEECARPLRPNGSVLAPATGQPLAKLLVPALVPEPGHHQHRPSRAQRARHASALSNGRLPPRHRPEARAVCPCRRAAAC